MEYIVLDSYFEGSGVRNIVSEEYINIDDLNIDKSLKQEIKEWKKEYDEAFLKNRLNKDLIDKLDEKALKICFYINYNFKAYKVDYYYSEYLSKRIYING
jgi:hypothetical protein